MAKNKKTIEESKEPEVPEIPLEERLKDQVYVNYMVLSRLANIESVLRDSLEMQKSLLDTELKKIKEIDEANEKIEKLRKEYQNKSKVTEGIFR